MEGLLTILGKIGFDWQVALANLFNFLIIFFVLKRFAFKPIGKIIKERQDRINEGLMNAESNEKILLNTKKEYEAVLLEARIQASQLIQESKKEASITKEKILGQTKDEVDLMLKNGKKSLELEKVKILDSARQEIVDLVVKTTEKVLGNKVDKTYSVSIMRELSNL